MKPYEITYKNDNLFDSSRVAAITLPAIGKTEKAIRYEIPVVKEGEEELFAFKMLNERIKALVKSFLNCKERRFVFLQSQPGAYGIADLSARVSEFKYVVQKWGENDFYGYLRGFILPKMELLRTHNVQNKFYQYENDLMNYLNAAIEYRAKKESL